MHAELGEAVCELRRRLQWSQEQLAQGLGKNGRRTHSITVSRWERGVDSPSPEKRTVLTRIAQRKGYEDLAIVLRAPISVWHERSRNGIAVESRSIQTNSSVPQPHVADAGIHR